MLHWSPKTCSRMQRGYRITKEKGDELEQQLGAEHELTTARQKMHRACRTGPSRVSEEKSPVASCDRLVQYVYITPD